MKKLLGLFALIPTLILASCGSNNLDTTKIALDTGNIYSKSIAYSDFHEMDYDELEACTIDKLSFVLVTFNDRTCGCWRDFIPMFVHFANDYHYQVKLFDVALFEGHNNKFGVYSVKSQMPGICFFRRGKLIRQIVYGKSEENNRKIFKYNEYEKTYEKFFIPFMLENVYMPKLYYVDKETLDDMIESKQEFNLYVARTSCGDCGRIEKDYIHGWVDKNKTTTINDCLYIFDIQSYRSDMTVYQEIKDAYGLSNVYNTDFGYDTGYVPTFQRWKDAAIIDMITVLNDSVDSNLKVTSYFNQSRISKSPLLKDTGDKYLFDQKVVTEDDVTSMEYEGVTYTFLKQDVQFKWHKPIVEMFFNEYVK